MLKNWELIKWGDEDNISISLSEEQMYVIFKALNLNIKPLPNNEYEISTYSDDYLKSLRLKK
jgi:hypothetical protein